MRLHHRRISQRTDSLRNKGGPAGWTGPWGETDPWGDGSVSGFFCTTLTSLMSHISGLSASQKVKKDPIALFFLLSSLRMLVQSRAGP